MSHGPIILKQEDAHIILPILVELGVPTALIKSALPLDQQTQEMQKRITNFLKKSPKRSGNYFQKTLKYWFGIDQEIFLKSSENRSEQYVWNYNNRIRNIMKPLLVSILQIENALSFACSQNYLEGVVHYVEIPDEDLPYAEFILAICGIEVNKPPVYTDKSGAHYLWWMLKDMYKNASLEKWPRDKDELLLILAQESVKSIRTYGYMWDHEIVRPIIESLVSALRQKDRELLELYFGMFGKTKMPIKELAEMRSTQSGSIRSILKRIYCEVRRLNKGQLGAVYNKIENEAYYSRMREMARSLAGA